MASSRSFTVKATAQGVIRDWQESASPGTAPEEDRTIANLVRGCLQLSEDLLSAARASHSLPTKSKALLRRQHEIFKLWVDGHEALSGHLDRDLHRSPNLQRTTLVALNALCGNMIYGLSRLIFLEDKKARASLLRNADAYAVYEQSRAVISTFGLPNEDGDTDSESTSDEDTNETSFEDHLSEYIINISDLTDLSTTLQHPAKDPEGEVETASHPSPEDRTPSQYYTDLIHTKYPKASSEIADCLGAANWIRYQRLQAERAIAAQKESPVIDMTRSQIADSEFRDSGLGSSVPEQASLYAETIASFKSSLEGGHRAHIPPLPAEAKTGTRFECVACGNFITASSTQLWRRHLFGDLQPYVCIFKGCSNNRSQTFRDRNDYANHIVTHHKQESDDHKDTCPLCLRSVEEGQSALLAHCARHMEEIALAALPARVDSDDELDSDSNSVIDAGTAQSTSIDAATGISSSLPSRSPTPISLAGRSPDALLIPGFNETSAKDSTSISGEKQGQHSMTMWWKEQKARENREKELLREKNGGDVTTPPDPIMAALPESETPSIPGSKKPSTPSTSHSSPTTSNNSRNIVCQECNQIFDSRDTFKKHMRKHNKPFICDVLNCRRAGRGFCTINDLNRHKKSVHRVGRVADSYQCVSEHCRNREKIWPRLDNFKQHIRRMHKEENEQDLIERSRYQVEKEVMPELVRQDQDRLKTRRPNVPSYDPNTSTRTSPPQQNPYTYPYTTTFSASYDRSSPSTLLQASLDPRDHEWGTKSRIPKRFDSTEEKWTDVYNLKAISCVLCRKDNKHCDGERPTCGTCKRLAHDCTYGRVPKKIEPTDDLDDLFNMDYEHPETTEFDNGFFGFDNPTGEDLRAAVISSTAPSATAEGYGTLNDTWYCQNPDCGTLNLIAASYERCPACGEFKAG